MAVILRNTLPIQKINKEMSLAGGKSMQIPQAVNSKGIGKNSKQHKMYLFVMCSERLL